MGATSTQTTSLAYVLPTFWERGTAIFRGNAMEQAIPDPSQKSRIAILWVMKIANTFWIIEHPEPRGACIVGNRRSDTRLERIRRNILIILDRMEKRPVTKLQLQYTCKARRSDFIKVLRGLCEKGLVVPSTMTRGVKGDPKQWILTNEGKEAAKQFG